MLTWCRSRDLTMEPCERTFSCWRRGGKLICSRDLPTSRDSHGCPETLFCPQSTLYQSDGVQVKFIACKSCEVASIIEELRFSGLGVSYRGLASWTVLGTAQYWQNVAVAMIPL